MHQNNRNQKYFFLLPLLSLLTLSTLLTLGFSRNFFWQIGMSHDSVFYLSGAESLLSREGYPYTHFPPLYPATLALIAFITNKDIISSATILSILLYGINTFLIGFLILNLKNSLLGSLSISIVFALLPGIVRIFFEAMSEPLFFSFLLISFIFLVEYRKTGSQKWAILAGFTAGLCALTRYIAIFLIASIAFFVLIINKDSIKKRISNGFIAGISGVIPLSAWWVSNQASKGTMTNRFFVYHPKNLEFFKLGLREFSSLIGAQYITKWTLRLPGIIFIICIYLIAALIIFYIARNIIRKNLNSVNLDFVFICLISSFFYVLTLLVSVTFFDDSTTLTARILSPVLIQIFLCIWVLFWPTNQNQEMIRFDRILLPIIVALLIFINLPGYLTVTKTFKNEGFLFTGKAWSTSKTLSWINSLPDSTIIFSNENIPLSFFTRYRTYSLPERKNVSSGVPNKTFEENNEEMINKIRTGKAILIIFTKNSYSELYESKELLTKSLVKCNTFEDSEVYTGQMFFQEYCRN